MSASALRTAGALSAELSRSLGIPTAAELFGAADPRPLDAPLQGLFAAGGLPRGEVLDVAGPGSLTLALACAAATTRGGGWCAGLGLGELAPTALADLGVRLDRFVSAEVPAQDWLRVAGILADSFAALIAAPGFSPTPHDDERLRAKVRDSRCTLLLLDAEAGPDARRAGQRSRRGHRRLTVLAEEWEGAAHGSGRLERRRMRIQAAHGPVCEIVLPSEAGGPAESAPAQATAPALPAVGESAPQLRLVPAEGSRG